METGSGKGCAHSANGLCNACELMRAASGVGDVPPATANELERGQRIAERLAAVMREEGLEEAPDQFGTMLGLAVAGFARCGTSVETLVDAVRQAHQRALASGPTQ